MTKHRTITLALAGLAAAGALATITPAPAAHADPASDCRIDNWGFLGFSRRTICDSPIRPDGSWERHRVIWTPAHYVPATTTCSGYSFVTCTTWGGYFVDTSIAADETYPVTPDTVLPDEPGHMGGGGGRPLV